MADWVWEYAAEQFPERELCELAWAICSNIAWNRLAVTARPVVDGVASARGAAA